MRMTYFSILKCDRRPFNKMEKPLCFIKHFTLFHEKMPKKPPNGLFVPLFDQMGGYVRRIVRSFFTEKTEPLCAAG
jgi:hypothetical protein